MRQEQFQFQADVTVTIDSDEGMHVLYLSGTDIDKIKRLLTNHIDDGK